MKIYDTEGFPNPLRVRIALAEKGATNKVEFVPVDVMGWGAPFRCVQDEKPGCHRAHAGT